MPESQGKTVTYIVKGVTYYSIEELRRHYDIHINKMNRWLRLKIDSNGNCIRQIKTMKEKK